MDLIYKGKEECPFCKKKFETMRVRNSRVVVQSQDSDFCQHFKDDVNPIFYEVSVCPHCSYAFTKNSKKPYEPYYSLVKESYIDKVVKPMQLCQERSIEDAITSFKMLYLVSITLKEKKIALGNIALKLAWLYRYKGDSEKEMSYLTYAVDFFESGLATEGGGVSDEKLTYLIAELNFRIGKYGVSRKWFSNLITSKSISEKYRKLAVDRWQEIREENQEVEGENLEEII